MFRRDVPQPEAIISTFSEEDIARDRLKFANQHADWYRKKKREKQNISAAIRISALLLLGLGSIYPLVSRFYAQCPPEAGYALLAVSGGLLLFDRALGLSRSWIRFMRAGLEIEAAKDLFIVKWQVAEIQERRLLAIRFTEEVNEIVLEETSEWGRDFERRLAEQKKVA